MRGRAFPRKSTAGLIISLVLGGIAGAAVLQGSWAVSLLWLFWAAPIAGAVIGGLIYSFIGKEEKGAR